MGEELAGLMPSVGEMRPGSASSQRPGKRRAPRRGTFSSATSFRSDRSRARRLAYARRCTRPGWDYAASSPKSARRWRY